MTRDERNLLDSIKAMEQDAPNVGLCSMPFTVLYTQVAQIIEEKDQLLRFRVSEPVKPRKGWYGQCPSCGAVFLDDSTSFCGNCGQAITFKKEGNNDK